MQAAPIVGEYKIQNIQTNTTGGISDIGSYTATVKGVASLVMAAEAGRYTSYDGGYGAKATVSNIALNQGDVVRFVKINGGYGTRSFGDGGLAVGGSGVALYVNNVLKLVVGGGGGADTKNVVLVAGGGGYEGGYADPLNASIGQQYRGYSITGSVGNSTRNELTSGDGSVKTDYRRAGFFSEVFYGYGGSGYNALPSTAPVSFSTNQGAGYVNLTFNPN